MSDNKSCWSQRTHSLVCQSIICSRCSPQTVQRRLLPSIVQTSNYSLSHCFSHYRKIQTMLLLPVITSLSHHSKVGQHLLSLDPGWVMGSSWSGWSWLGTYIVSSCGSQVPVHSLPKMWFTFIITNGMLLLCWLPDLLKATYRDGIFTTWVQECEGHPAKNWNSLQSKIPPGWHEFCAQSHCGCTIDRMTYH